MISREEAYEYMYYDLLSNRLEVYLIPSINEERYIRNGCCSRAVQSTNPKWYQKFCSFFLDYRGKTIIKRKETLRLLCRLKDGKVFRSKYIPYLEDENIILRKSLNISSEDMQFYIEYGKLPEDFNDQF